MTSLDFRTRFEGAAISYDPAEFVDETVPASSSTLTVSRPVVPRYASLLLR